VFDTIGAVIPPIVADVIPDKFVPVTVMVVAVPQLLFNGVKLEILGTNTQLTKADQPDLTTEISLLKRKVSEPSVAVDNTVPGEPVPLNDPAGHVGTGAPPKSTPAGNPEEIRGALVEFPL
jgi:hypothetical protein